MMLVIMELIICMILMVNMGLVLGCNHVSITRRESMT